MLIKVINFKEASSKNLDENLISIKDVTDGCLYRSFLQTNEGKIVLKGHAITLSINTDGCNPSDNPSAPSLWPVFISINEIPLNQRYCIENTIIAGKN